VLHGPGANRGRLVFIALVLASLAVGLIGKLINQDDDSFPGRCVLAAWILCCYLAALVVLGDYLYRGPARSWLDTTALRRGFLLVLFAAFSLGPILAALVVDANGWDRNGSIAMLSPIMGVSEALSGSATDRDLSLGIISLIGIAALALLLVQGLRLRITTQRIAAREDDRNPRGG
jgi:hypothetical protein